ncbi:hypothetical protein BBJ28_00017876 [Nothophytophthora sp. Chile5]|nr:hypothetical protein BBJ28_00017876 [Nothophytophthora sp. Chile5]
MLRRNKKRKRVDTSTEEDAEFDASIDLIDDTLSSIQLLTNRNADGFAETGLPPLVLWHQLSLGALFLTCHPSSCLLIQVNRLRNEGKLVTFKLPSGTEDVAVLRTADYVAEVQKHQRTLRKHLDKHPKNDAIRSKLKALAAFSRAVPRLRSLSTVPLKVLLSTMSTGGSTTFSEQEIRDMVVWVQRLGFLLPTTRLDDEAFYLSIPGIGKLISSVKKTRAVILSTLKRTKYKEMHEQQLQKAKLKHSHFQMEFHLADMEGCGLIRRTKVTSGVLVALTNK